MEQFRLDGKRALITGGSKGIGFGIAQQFAAAGADLVLVARNSEDLREAQTTLSASRRVDVFSFDLSHTAGIGDLYAAVLRKSGPVDILVNNAGVNLRGPSEDIALETWRTVIEVNLTAVFAMSQAFARERISSAKAGKIVNVASLMSEGARRTIAPYVASKGGVKQLTKALAVDWAPYGINVNAIGPGFIETSMNAPLLADPDFNAWVRKRTPLGRWGAPSDVASAALFLASPASDFVTGQVLYVDGGWLATF